MTARIAGSRPGAAWSERTLPTPEGVDLTVRLASRGERLGAVIIDLLFILFAVLALLIVISLFAGRSSGWAVAFGLLANFAIRVLYFPGFELRRHGQTPGKRLMGIRVIDRHGGPLRADAVIARNLLREVEIFLPMTLILSQPEGEYSGLITLSAIAWSLALTALPLFNRDALRAGDIVAGTWVVLDPKPVLTADLATETGHILFRRNVSYQFSRAQLDAYGIRELEALARVLRVNAAAAAELEADVYRRITRKIAWQAQEGEDPRQFLIAYYGALRGHLEKRLLFGKRRLSKYDPV